MSYTRQPYVVSVTTSPTLLQDTPAQGVRIRARVLKNLGASSVYLGGPTVAASATGGWELAAGETFSDSLSNGDIYAITASGSVNVMVWEAIN